MRSLSISAAWLLSSAVAAADVAPAPAPTPAAAAPAAPAPAPAEDKPYLIGMERTLSDAIVQTEGRGLAGYLSAALNHPVKGRIYKTYDDLADALAKGEIDLAWINPYSYVKASSISHVFPVAKALRHGDSYKGVLFVRSDSKAKTLADLKGMKVAWVDQTSTAGYLFPQAMLLKQHINPARFFASQSYAGTHRAVCDAVASGAADVGATFHNGNAPNDFRPDGCVETMGQSALTTFTGVALTDSIPSEVIAARADFDASVAAKLGGILASMSETDAGRGILKDVFRADGFGIALDTDFDGVKAAAQLVASGKPAPTDDSATKKRKKKSKASQSN